MRKLDLNLKCSTEAPWLCLMCRQTNPLACANVWHPYIVRYLISLCYLPLHFCSYECHWVSAYTVFYVQLVGLNQRARCPVIYSAPFRPFSVILRLEVAESVELKRNKVQFSCIVLLFAFDTATWILLYHRFRHESEAMLRETCKCHYLQLFTWEVVRCCMNLIRFHEIFTRQIRRHCYNTILLNNL